jgi:hypothetical protein
MTPLQRLQSIVKENPNRSLKVIPIEIRVISDTQEGEEAPASIEGGWVPTPLEPPGPVALWLWKTNPEFRAGASQVRRTILRDALIPIQVRVEAELKGIKWHRKKVIEQLVAQQTAAVSPPMETPELDEALCELFGYQKIVVDEAGKKVKFFPADPRTWTAERPVWAATTGARAAVHCQGEQPVGPGQKLVLWLEDREKAGWRIQWPEAEGGMEALKDEMRRNGWSLSPRITKPKKQDWAEALGRAAAIRHLSKLGSQ